MGKVIVVMGTPGTGKTTLAKMLAEKLGAVHIDLSELVLKEGLYTDYDEEVASFVIDEEALVRRVKEIIENNKLVIIDSHYGEIIPREYVEKVIVLRTDPEVLEERLKKKGWWWDKIRENIEAEILSVCTHNAIQVFGEDKVYEIDTSNKSPEEILEEALKIIRGEGEPGLKYDWLSLKPFEKLEKYFSK
ncbi:adenylate kinase family protein [Desulfurococcaceae archaeon MEX13E-LK6-19]|nr:adenylate kinase family protein [Desulfurococcaceae archaeon MEX13E-LK6-19]